MGPKPFFVEDYSGIPAQLRELRLDSGLSVKQVADQMGVSASSVSNWEYGTRNMTLNSLVDYCRVINATVTVEFRNTLLTLAPRR